MILDIDIEDLKRQIYRPRSSMSISEETPKMSCKIHREKMADQKLTVSIYQAKRYCYSKVRGNVIKTISQIDGQLALRPMR